MSSTFVGPGHAALWLCSELAYQQIACIEEVPMLMYPAVWRRAYAAAVDAWGPAESPKNADLWLKLGEARAIIEQSFKDRGNE